MTPAQEPTRVCRKCGVARPLRRYYKGNLRCNDCINERERFMRHNPGCPTIFELRRERTEKPCVRCGEIKTVDCFPKRQDKCKACQAELNRIWRNENREAIAASDKDFRARNAVAIKQRLQAQYRENREKFIKRARDYYHANRETIKVYARAYYEKNAAAFMARANARRALIESITDEQSRLEIEAFYEHVRSAPRLRCRWCKRITPK